MRSFRCLPPVVFRLLSAAVALAVLSWASRSPAVDDDVERMAENPPGQPLTLQECVQEAINNNATVREAIASVESAKGGVIVAKAALYPQVETALRVGYENDDLFNSRPSKTGDNNDFYERWQIELKVTRRLFDGTGTRQTIAISQLQKDISWNTYLAAVNDAAYNAEVAFYRILYARKRLAVRIENYARLTDLTSRQKALVEGGQATHFDVLRTEVKAANELPLIEELRSEVIAAEAALQQVMGRRFDPASFGRIAISGDFTTPRYDLSLSQLITQAIRNSPLLTAAEKRIELSARQELKARAAKYPQFDAFVGMLTEKTNRESHFFDNRTQFAFGVLGQWTIFDGFESKGRVEEAKGFYERDTVLREELGRQIQFDALRALLDLREAQTIMSAGELNLKNAQASLDSLSKSLEMGMTTQLDVYDANSDLLLAQILLLQARFNYQTAIAKLEKVTSAFIRNLGAPAGPQKSR